MFFVQGKVLFLVLDFKILYRSIQPHDVMKHANMVSSNFIHSFMTMESED